MSYKIVKCFWYGVVLVKHHKGCTFYIKDNGKPLSLKISDHTGSPVDTDSQTYLPSCVKHIIHFHIYYLDVK